MGREGGVQILVMAIAIIISSALCLCGCDQLPFGGGKQKQKAAPKKPPTGVPQKATPTPSVEPAEEEKDYVYDPTGKRDPFQPFIATQTPVRPLDEEVPITPLQKYDLTQLKLVAILVGKGEGRAMVEDAEGKGYIIEKGVYVGRNFGKVKAILKDRVIIEERYKDYMGTVKQKEIVLQLHPPEEERGL